MTLHCCNKFALKGCLHNRLNGPSVRRTRIRPAAAQQLSTVQQQSDVFDTLAGLLCPNELHIGVGHTQYGRGLVAREELSADEVLLSTDAFSTLLVVDEPLRTGAAFGASVLSDWQSVWGIELPALLTSYLQSSEWQLRQGGRRVTCGVPSADARWRVCQHDCGNSVCVLQAGVTGSGA